MNTAETALRTMRILHGVFLFTVVLYVAAPWMAVTQSKELPMIVAAVMGVVASTWVAAVFFFYSQKVRPWAARLQSNPGDKQAAGQWRAGLILCFAFSETIVLFGLALKLLGAPWKLAAIFYAVGTLLLIWCAPKLELLPE